MSDTSTKENQETKTETKQYTQAEVDELINGLKTKNGELLGEVKGLKGKLKEFDGVDLDAFKAWQQKAKDDEEKALIAKGQFEELFNTRLQRVNENHKTELDAIKKERDLFALRALSDGIRQAAAKADLHNTAIDDAILRAKTDFEIDGNGDIAPIDKLLGKDGKPLSLSEWFDEMRQKAPHWFKAPNGGGTGGVGGNGQSSGFNKADLASNDHAKRKAAIKAYLDGKK